MRRKSLIRPEQYAHYTNGDIAEILPLLRHRSSKLAFLLHAVRSNMAHVGYKYKLPGAPLRQARRLLSQFGG